MSDTTPQRPHGPQRVDGAPEVPEELPESWIPEGAAATLVLDDGTLFKGRAASPIPPTHGEAVFTTAMGGYPESMSDPSYRGQVLVFTYPEIGIYGVHPACLESEGVWARALVVHRACKYPSLRDGFVPLTQAARAAGRGVLEGVDTRALARHLRTGGTRTAAILPGHPGKAEAAAHLAALGPADTSPPVAGMPGEAPETPRARIHLVDFGVKDGIRASLLARGAEVTLYDPARGIQPLLDAKPDGVLLSNGPGDPGQMDTLVDLIRGWLGKVPIQGVCLGHQLLARALGATTEKLPFGHRGVNHPVMDHTRDQVLITSQNHGFAVAASAANLEGVEVTHTHCGDGSVEGIRHQGLDARSVQFHPEARPGPVDAAFLFEDFLQHVAGRGAAPSEGDPA